MHKRNSIQCFINPGEQLESAGKDNSKEYYNLLSQTGALLSQATILPTMMHAVEDSPMSWYLEAKNNECYLLSSQVISLLRSLLTKKSQS